MFRKLRPRSIYDVMATIGCFAALAGGTAYAANTIGSTDIIDGQVKAVDIGNNEVGSADVKDGSLNTFDVHSFIGEDVIDNTLTGADVNESTLGTVPSAALGGVGRNGLLQNGNLGPGTCNPESATYVNCDIAATLTLSRPARVLVIGSVRASPEGADSGIGTCLLGTTSGSIPGSTVAVSTTAAAPEHLSIAGVTGVFPAGQHSFGIDCNEAFTIAYGEARVTAVALSDQ